MVDQAPATPPAQTPNTPPAAPPQVLQPEAVVAVKVDGKTFNEPVSKVVASYQMQSAAEKRLADANAILQSRKAQVEFAERFQQQMASNPEAALEEIQRFASQQLGRKVQPKGWGAPQGESGDGTGSGEGAAPTGHDPAVAATLRELQAKIGALETTRAQESATRDVQSALDQYPVLKSQDEAGRRLRAFAESSLIALKAQNPSASYSDLASEFHAGLQGLATAQATSQRDANVARANLLAGIPAQAGTPGLTDREPPPTVADMKKPGALKAKLEQFYLGVQRGLAGSR